MKMRFFINNKGTVIKQSEKLLSEYLAYWLKIKLGENEIGEQAHSVTNPLFVSVKIQHIEKVMEELSTKGLASGTRKKIYNILNNAFTEAVLKKEISENVVLQVKKPIVKHKEMEFWDRESVARNAPGRSFGA